MATVTRSDIFGRIHKGLRKALFDLAFIAGRTDYTNDADLARLVAQGTETIYFLRKHAQIEESYQLPLLAGKAAGVAEKIAGEHEEIEERIDALEKALAQLNEIESDHAAHGEAIYFQVNSFIASYLLHMEEEETEVAPLFFQHCTDEELRSMLMSILATNAPSDTMLAMKYTIPAIDSAERAGFLGEVKKAAPPQAFEHVMRLAQSILPEQEWAALQEALEIPEPIS